MTEPTHVLKCLPAYFEAALAGVKPFELRRDDRGFEVGHYVTLAEFDAIACQTTGRTYGPRRITFILREAPGFGLMRHHVVLGLAPISQTLPEGNT